MEDLNNILKDRHLGLAGVWVSIFAILIGTSSLIRSFPIEAAWRLLSLSIILLILSTTTSIIGYYRTKKSESKLGLIISSLGFIWILFLVINIIKVIF